MDLGLCVLCGYYLLLICVARSSPYLFCHGLAELQLGVLRLLGDGIAVVRGAEAALRADGELVETAGQLLGCFAQLANERGLRARRGSNQLLATVRRLQCTSTHLVLHVRDLGRYQTENDLQGGTRGGESAETLTNDSRALPTVLCAERLPDSAEKSFPDRSFSHSRK